MRLTHGKVFLGKHFRETSLEFDDRIIAVGDITEDRLDGEDASGCYIIPGLVDIHTHGAVGEDFSDGKPAGLDAMEVYYARHGVTSYLATTLTLPEDVLTDAMHVVRDHQRKCGAKCAGVHLEGPFLCYAKRGAQAAEHLHKPDTALFHRLDDASGGQVRMVTVACEEEGALAFIREVSRQCTVSLGHSVAGYDQAMAAFDAGASHATHLFNGMDPLHHRNPAIIGAAFDAGASVELICDGLHIHPAVIRMVHQLYGDRLNLISDSLRCAGMPDGQYDLGGQQIEVKNHKATLLGTDTLAGSSISVLDALRNVVRFGLPLEDAVYAATTAPAMAVGLDVGVIAVGHPADLTVLDEHLNLRAVYVDGVLQNLN